MLPLLRHLGKLLLLLLLVLSTVLMLDDSFGWLRRSVNCCGSACLHVRDNLCRGLQHASGSIFAAALLVRLELLTAGHKLRNKQNAYHCRLL